MFTMTQCKVNPLRSMSYAKQAKMTLDNFLRQHEKRAFRMAYIATHNHDDALEIVQESMLKLAHHYASKDSELWKPLFLKIVQSKIRDWYRREKVRQQWRVLWPFTQEQETELSLEELHGDAHREPGKLLQESNTLKELDKILHSLPLRQQQAFLLRIWEGMDTRETAEAMGCSEGSVKTHFHRATQVVKAKLGDHWP